MGCGASGPAALLPAPSLGEGEARTSSKQERYEPSPQQPPEQGTRTKEERNRAQDAELEALGWAGTDDPTEQPVKASAPSKMRMQRLRRLSAEIRRDCPVTAGFSRLAPEPRADPLVAVATPVADALYRTNSKFEDNTSPPHTKEKRHRRASADGDPRRRRTSTDVGGGHRSSTHADKDDKTSRHRRSSTKESSANSKHGETRSRHRRASTNETTRQRSSTMAPGDHRSRRASAMAGEQSRRSSIKGGARRRTSIKGGPAPDEHVSSVTDQEQCNRNLLHNVRRRRRHTHASVAHDELDEDVEPAGASPDSAVTTRQKAAAAAKRAELSVESVRKRRGNADPAEVEKNASKWAPRY